MLREIGSLASIKRARNFFLRKENVAMFHTGRCGSTVLGNMLNKHSHVVWDSEILRNFTPLEEDSSNNSYLVSKRFVQSRLYSRKSKIYGFETKYLPQQHLGENHINMSLEKYFSILIELRFSKFIVIQRENYLRRAISEMVGRKTQEWHTKRSKSEPTRIEIDTDQYCIGREGYYPEPLLKTFQCMDENYLKIKEILSNHSSLFLSYEKDIQNDPRRGYEKICTFLHIQSENPAIDIQRTNPFPIKDVLINFEEVKHLLENTKYAWMVEDS